MFKYHAYGLNISSEMELNELIAKDFSVEADVILILGEVPEELTGDEWHESFWQINETSMLFNYSGIIKALINLRRKP